jgi:hypothetical protein
LAYLTDTASAAAGFRVVVPAVAVSVLVANITQSVVVEIGLIFVGGIRAVVVDVQHPILVPVVASIAFTVVVCVQLILIGGGEAVVVTVLDSVVAA